MQLAALTAGIGADTQPFSGSVHSVFDSACTLAGDDGRLLALVGRASGAVPRGFQLATPPGFRFRDHVPAGARVASRAGILRIETSALRVDLRAARPWRSLRADGAVDLSRPPVARALDCARAELGGHDLGGLSMEPVAALIAATAKLDDAAARALARPFIGRGAGLTPAGDDFLVGFLAGLWRAHPLGPARHDFLERFGDAIAAAAAATGAISRLYLEAAITGEIAEPLATLAANIAAGAPPAQVVAAARRALAVGASSGAAGTLGLLSGAAVWGEAASEPFVAPQRATMPSPAMATSTADAPVAR